MRGFVRLGPWPKRAPAVALAGTGATRWVGFQITETEQETYRRERRGRAGNDTRFRRAVKPVFTITAEVNAARVAYDAVTDAVTDDCFPLASNADDLSPVEVFAAQGYPSEPTSRPRLRRKHDAKAALREGGPGWAGGLGGRAAPAGPSWAWGSR